MFGVPPCTRTWASGTHGPWLAASRTGKNGDPLEVTVRQVGRSWYEMSILGSKA